MKKTFIFPIAMVVLVALFVGAIIGNKYGQDKQAEAQKEQEEAENKKIVAQAVSDPQDDTVVALIPEYSWENCITLGAYTGLTIEKTKVEVSDESVMEEINSNLVSEQEVTTRGAKADDTVNISFTGTVDGKEFEDGTQEDYDITLGYGDYLEAFDKDLEGVKTGETVTIKATLPDDFTNEDVAGKKATFEVTVNKISESVQGTLDEAAAKEAGYNNVEEYKTAVKSDLVQQANSEAKEEADNNALQAIMETSKLNDCPAELLESYKSDWNDYLESSASQFGMSLEDYKGMMYETDEDFESEVKNSILGDFVLQGIADKDNITLTKEEYEKGAAAYFDEENAITTVAELEDAYGGEEVVKRQVLKDKIYNYILEQNTVKEVEPATEEEVQEDTAEEDATDE